MAKMVEFLRRKTKLTRLIALSTRIPKRNFFREALISGEGRPENLGKMGNNRDTYCYVYRGEVNFERKYY